MATGTVTFNGDGTLASTAITPNYPAATPGAPIGINWLDTAGAADSSIAFDLGTVDAADGLSQFDRRLQRRLRACRTAPKSAI